MTRPGERLRRLATRCSTERARRRLIDPAIADLQAEVIAAQRAGSTWRTARAFVTGYVAIAKVIAIAACGDVRHQVTTWAPGERAGAWRGVRIAVLTTVITTLLLEANMIRGIRWMVVDGPGGSGLPGILAQAAMVLYLVPSTLTLTAPLGIVLGLARALHGDGRTGKLGVITFLAAAVWSTWMYANVAWITPDANQAFRQVAMARLIDQGARAPVRGDNELTLAVLRVRLRDARAFGQTHEARFYERLYQQKLAMTVAVVPMVGVMLALAFGRRWNRTRLTVAAIAVFALYYAGLVSSTYTSTVLGAPPILATWWANGLCAVTAMLLAVMPRREATSSRARSPA